MNSKQLEAIKFLESEVTTLATLWKITLKNGKQLGFTDHDTDIKYLDTIYNSNSGFTPHAMQSNIMSKNNNIEIEGILNSEQIRKEDIMSGLYDNASIEVFLIDYTNQTGERLNLKFGYFGEISLHTNSTSQFKVEVYGLSDLLSKSLGETYSPICRAKFCDNKCQLNIDEHKYTGEVTAVASNIEFEASEFQSIDNRFQNGILTFKSGNNKNLSFEVQSNENQKFILFTAAPNPISVGDTFSISSECDKKFNTCKYTYNNTINFQGEPHIPGIENLV